MCGILGLCFDRSGATHQDVLADFGMLMLKSQARGTDACGVYIVDREEGIKSWRQPNSVADNVDEMMSFVSDNIGANTVAIVGHTRAATLGHPSINDNNHPIIDGSVIGVHNGIIRNHAELHTKYTKVAEVDSASIMALLRHRVESESKLTTKTLTSSLHELEGPFAIAVADMESPDGIFMARNTNPVVFSRNRARHYLAFASTSEIMTSSLGAVETFSMPKNTACRISVRAVSKRLRYIPIEKLATGRRPVAKSGSGYNPRAQEYHKPGKLFCDDCGQYQMFVYLADGEEINLHECEVGEWLENNLIT